MKQYIAAFVYDPDRDVIRQVCVGCSQLLYFSGFLVKVNEICLIKNQPEAVAVLYNLAQDYTMEDCKEYVKGTHIGGRWSE